MSCCQSSKPVAALKICEPGKMMARERRDIVRWLRWHAAHLAKQGKNYTTGTFTGRFSYT